MAVQGNRVQLKADLEAAVRLGDRAYWIASHGRNSSGNVRVERHQFFATELRMDAGGRVTVVPVGTSRDLGPALRARSPVLAAAIGDAGRNPELAPEEKGLNIEGLAAGGDGRSLMIGLRNPLDGEGRALVVPLENPAEVVGSTNAEPRFGEPIPLDLGRRGIRSMEWVSARRAYLVVAGPTGNASEFDLYLWSGRREEPPEVVRGAADVLRRIDRFHPEAVVVDAEGRRALLIGDDGDFPLRGDDRACKKLNPGERAFRAVLLVLE